MDVIIAWFIMTNGFGYIPPQHVQPTEMRCGLAGEVVGVKVDRLVNPTLALWPDPEVKGLHCEVDIRARVLSLAFGEYHLATTIVAKLGGGSYIGHDPHTSEKWMRSATDPVPSVASPTNFRIQGSM